MKNSTKLIIIFFGIIIYPIQTMELTLVTRKTPKKYYDYKYLHSDYRLKEWEKKKKNIMESISQTNNNADAIKIIVNKTEYKTWGYTPLCSAVEMNDFQFSQFLIDNGAEINETIRGVHSSKPIFFARTLEMVQLLQKNKVNFLQGYNQGTGFTRGMNFLHQILHMGTYSKCDDRLVIYLLSLGFKIEDTVLPEDTTNICSMFSKALELNSSLCCSDNLDECIKRVCKKLSSDS